MEAAPRDIMEQTSRVCLHHPAVAASGACERCRRPFCDACLVPLRGQRLCGDCKHHTLCGSFRYVPAIPGAAGAGPAPLTPPPVTGLNVPVKPGLEAPCSLHAESPAVQVCERCGDFMCALCCTIFEGRFYCLRCFDLLWGRGSLTGRGYGVPNTAVWLSVAAWLTFCVPFIGPPLAIGGIVMGAVALNRIAREPELEGRSNAILAIVLGVAQLLIAAVVFLAIWRSS